MCKPMSLRCLINKLPKLKQRLLRKGGRNHTGQITVFHKGGGLKVCYRFVDFWRNSEIPAIVVRIERDPIRTSYIALTLSLNGIVSYILAVELLEIGDLVRSGAAWVGENVGLLAEKITTSVGLPYGSCLPLGFCPLGLEVSNVELLPGVGGQICRAAGTKALVVKKSGGFVILKLKSGWCLVLSRSCKAVIGVMSNSMHMFDIVRKAGRNRNRGIKPTVRGVAMNPVDHPHGGGEGKASGGKRPLSPWGKITKGKSTVTKNKRLKLRPFRFKE